PETLKAAAEAAGGTFIDAAETDKASRVKAALSTLRTQARASLGTEGKTPRYQWFLFPAFALLLLDTFLLERRGRRRPSAAAAHTAAASALLVLSLDSCVGLNRTQEAVEAYHRTQFIQSAGMFRDLITSGDKREEILYNFGTALVAADSDSTAAEALERVVDSKND